MASGPGRARGSNRGIRIQEPDSVQRAESEAAAAAAAATAESPPTAPPSGGLQEQAHGPPGAGSREPSDADADAAAAAAAKKKGKMARPPSPPSSTSSEGTDSPVSSDIVSVSAAGESTSGDTPVDDGGGGRLKVSWKTPLVEGVVEVPKLKRHIDMKAAFDKMLQEGRWSEAERQLGLKGEPPKVWPEEAFNRSLWSRFKGRMANMISVRIARQMLGSNTDSTVMAHYVNHQTIPITRMVEHYERIDVVAGQGAAFHSNALNLRRAYSELRPVHGDGECFYRSFMFSYLEQVLDRQDTHEEHRLLAAVKGVARQHAHLGWISEFPRRRKTFKMLIKKVMRWKTHSRWKNVPTTNSYRKQKLLKFFNGYRRISDIFAFLRLVAAIWICSHSEQFEPLVPELNQDYTLRDWCFREVIQCKVFTDHVQMTALVTALGVPLRVECLLEGVSQDLYTGQDDSQEDTTRNTCWPHHHRQLPHGHVPPHVTVLYTNAHYDIIYPHRRDDHVPSIDESCSQKTAEVQRPSAESSKSTNCPGT